MAVPGKRGTNFYAGLLVCATALSACDLSAVYRTPGFPFQTGYGAAPGVPILLGNTAWWRGLGDPVLDDLVVLALRDSLGLELARERVVAARAARGGVPGAGMLTSSAGARRTGTDSRSSDVTGTATLGLDWMLDPYGARRGELRIAEADVDIAMAERDAARLLVLFNMVNAYAELRHSQRILALSRREMDSRLQTLALTQELLKAEAVTRLDITRSQARVAELRAQLPGLEAAVVAKGNEIAVLAGSAPGTLPPGLVAQLAKTGDQPVPNLSPKVGIPADLLRNRPDIRIAERRYYGAVTQIGVARAALYPRLSLGGAITLNAVEPTDSRAEYFFGPSIQFPSLPSGPARARVELRHSEARQAHTAWKATVLSAILEVENALVSYGTAATSIRSAREAVRLYDETFSLTREVFRLGEATLGDLVDTEQSRAAAARALADLRLRHTLGFIALNVAVGAGDGS